MNKKWHGGKGDAPRPVDKKKYDANYEEIDFSKKNEEKHEDIQIHEDQTSS